MSNKLSIIHLKGGAVVELADHMLRELIENVADPNTKAKATRKLSIEVVVVPDEERETAAFSIRTKSTLAPQKDVDGFLSFGIDNDGLPSASEMGGGTGIDPNRAILEGTVGVDNKSAAAGEGNETEHGNVTPMQRAAGGGR